MTNELIKATGEIVDWDDSKVAQVIQNSFAAGTSPEEFQAFRMMCESTGLSPVKKEVWCIVTGEGQWRKLQMMTGINGFYAIANRHPQMDGVECSYSEIKETQAGEHLVRHPEWIECRVFRKDRSRPQMFRAYWDEYHQPLVTRKGKLSIWGQKPSMMLEKCAESMALRKAFPQEMNGLYTAEEMSDEFAAPGKAKPSEVEDVEFSEMPENFHTDWEYSIQTEGSSQFGKSLQWLFENDPCWISVTATSPKRWAGLHAEDLKQLKAAYQANKQKLDQACTEYRKNKEQVATTQESEGAPEIITSNGMPQSVHLDDDEIPHF